MYRNSITRKDSRKKLCIITMYYWPFIPGKGTRHPKVITELLQNEFDLTVITSGRPLNLTWNHLSHQEFDGMIKVIRLPIGAVRSKGFLWRAVHEINFALRCVLVATKYVERGTLIFAAGPPHFFGTVIPFMKFMKSSTCLALLTDMFPDVLFDMQIVKSNILKSILKWVCLRTYKDADHLMVITDKLKERLIDYDINQDKITVVELAVDTIKFRPKSSIDYPKLGIPHLAEKFIVLYSGSFNQMYDFDLLIDTAKHFEHEAKEANIHFLIRGGGEQRDHIAEAIQKLGLRNVTLFGPVEDTEDIISYINTASVCVVPVRDSKSIHMTHPSKLFEFWACEKPIVCTATGELANLVERSQAGIAIPPGELEEMVSSIEYVYKNKAEAIRMGKRGRLFVEKEFSYNCIKPKLVDLVHCLKSK